MSKTLCIYHGNCADGFMAAWAVRNALGTDKVEFHAGVYGNPPPDVLDRAVIIVDFSYKRPVLEDMMKLAKHITVLDHHKTAAEDLQSMPDTAHFECLFDMTKSGARLAWEWFHPHAEVPRLVRIVEDRDLWKFEFPETRAVQACLFSYPYDFDIWSMLVEKCQTDAGMDLMVAEGEAIERKHHKDIAELVAVSKRPMLIEDRLVPVANLPYTLSSDAGHLMSKDAPFAACYMDTPEGRVFSLRSADDGADVSKVAKAYGGGGHAHAAGFRITHEQAYAMEVATKQALAEQKDPNLFDSLRSSISND